MTRCLCPDDCNCRRPWRTNYCGCREDHGLAQTETVHRLNAFTWAGRRAECAVTSEHLNTTGSSQTWEGVTCPECLATR